MSDMAVGRMTMILSPHVPHFRAPSAGQHDEDATHKELWPRSRVFLHSERAMTKVPDRHSGHHPGAVSAGQTPVDEVAQFEGGRPVLEPGVVAATAEFEALAAAAGDLGDEPLDVGRCWLVVLAKGWLRSPVPAARSSTSCSCRCAIGQTTLA